LGDGGQSFVRRASRERLTLEAIDGRTVARQMMVDELDGHVTTEPWVAGAVHVPLTTRAQEGKDLIGTEPRSGG